MGVRGFLGGLRQRRRGGTGKMQASHTNKIKRFHNLHYCFTCGWYVYHPGNACPLADTEYNMPNIPRAEAHMYANQVASMVAQNKSLPNGIGADMVWILANSIIRAQFVMHLKQEFARLHQKLKPYQPQK